MNATWFIRAELRMATTLALALLAASSCSKAPDQAAQPIVEEKKPAEAKATNIVFFPEELRVSDASVDQFVSKALNECADGKYDAFRLLWTAREEPISREEFEKGWHAAKAIRVRALEKVKLAAGEGESSKENIETVYALMVDLSLDPEQHIGQRKPERQVVLMLVREQDDWRLARAPKQMRDWVKKKMEAGEGKAVGSSSQGVSKP